MAHATSGDLASANSADGEHDQRGASPLKVLKASKSPALISHQCIPPPTKPQEAHEYAGDSGYGSASSTPDRQDTATPPRKLSQIPLIRQTGLFVSNKVMEPETRQRFREVHLQIEKMLLEFMRKLKPVQGRQKPIAIRSMMLGKTDADIDAKAYMVVICPENIKRKVQDFFDESLVKSLCEPEDHDIPSFRVLVIGHALRLRASSSSITVHCGSMNSFYDGKTTFCGTPIRLCDEDGHSRNATFGGVVKVTSNDGEYRLYGLTAGHLIKDRHVVTEEDDQLYTLYGNELVDLDLNDDATEDQTGNGFRATKGDIHGDGHDKWYSLNNELGKIISANGEDGMEGEQQSQMKPDLDWALFELNAHRPNQLGVYDRGQSKGDLHLKLPAKDDNRDNVFVHMLCASEGVKYGMLSTVHARVLLDPGDSFTDAYTLSLEGSKVSDGDSGSWVVDESRLEVYGHVIADDIFGDAYVIPMNDILTDIQRFFAARSVDLPTGLDVISIATQQHPTVLAGPSPREQTHSAFAKENPETGTSRSSHQPSEEAVRLAGQLVTERGFHISSAEKKAETVYHPSKKSKRASKDAERPPRGPTVGNLTTADRVNLPHPKSQRTTRSPATTIVDTRRKTVRFDEDTSHSGSSSSSSGWSRSGASSSSANSDYSEPAHVGKHGESMSEEQALKQALRQAVKEMDEWEAKVLDIEKQFNQRLRQADANLQVANTRCHTLEDEIEELQQEKKRLIDANKDLEVRIKAIQDDDSDDVRRKNDRRQKQPLDKTQSISIPSSNDKRSPPVVSIPPSPAVRIQQGPIQPRRMRRSTYIEPAGQKVLETGTRRRTRPGSVYVSLDGLRGPVPEIMSDEEGPQDENAVGF